MIRAFVDDLLHDRPRGPLGTLAKGPLWVASGLYGMGLSFWEAGYRKEKFAVHHLPRPVISVGNLTVGGTGKTTFVRTLTRLLVERGERVCILIRGYAAGDSGISDEAVELNRSLPGVEVVAGRDRVKGAREVFVKHPPTVFVLDDGFQHRRIHRDLDICLIDATSPFGNGHLLPRGILRERPSALARADLLILTHLEGWPPTSELMSFLAKTAPEVPVVFARHRPKACRLLGGDSFPLERLRQEKFLAFSGLGNPASLEKTLGALEARPVAHERFLDHHPYTKRELETIEEKAKRLGASALLTTQKDLARIRQAAYTFDMPCLILEVEMELFQNEQELTHRLDTVLQR